MLNAVLNGSVAALQQDLDAAAGAGAGGGAGGGGGGGARLLVLPEEMESLIQSMRPPFNSSGGWVDGWEGGRSGRRGVVDTSPN